MMKFIANQIIKKADYDLAEGQMLYRKYFIFTKIYAAYKSGVDQLLTERGYADVIVSE